MKQMIDISEKLISEQSDEISGVNPINWEDSSWKHLSLRGCQKVISLLKTRFYYFQILYHTLQTHSSSPLRKFTRSRPTSSLIVTSSLSRGSVFPAVFQNPRHPSAERHECDVHILKICTILSSSQVSRPFSKGWLSAWRMNIRRWVHPRGDQGGCSDSVWIGESILSTCSQTETSSLSALNGSITLKCCYGQISLVKEAVEFTTLLSRATWKSTFPSARSCTLMSCSQAARLCSKRLLNAWRANRRRCLHPRGRSRCLLLQCESSRYGMKDLSCLPPKFQLMWIPKGEYVEAAPPFSTDVSVNVFFSQHQYQRSLQKIFVF